MESAMNVDRNECYDLLGLSPGASREELKVAYRDLAKVWHPDRFLHDPRLQEKAQEKLKEINEAYDQLRLGRAKRQTQPPASSNGRPRTGDIAVVQRIRWHLILVPVLIFAVVFLATYRSLFRPSQQEHKSEVPTIEQPQALPNPESQQPGSRYTATNELLPGTDRIKAKSQREEPISASTSQASAAPLRPLPTVTVEIDPYTRMIARPDCPVKSTLTYPTGNEPQQLCNAVHPVKVSRLKSVTKRLASPSKWFGDEAKSDAGNKQEPKSP